MHSIDAAQIAVNITAVREKIALAARRAGRDQGEIMLVAVSKTYPPEAIAAAVEAGVTDIGESRVQEGTDKINSLGPVARWHLIGHLQSNKAARAVDSFDMIQSLDSTAIAEKVSLEAVKLGKTIDCLIEVNSSGEDSKYGFPPDRTIDAADMIARLPGITLRGVMTIGPWTSDEGNIREAFESTRRIFEMMKAKLGDPIGILSMGMSSDYELAVACGSTMVRVGAAVFGAR
jgi:hypothetical protein